ncbi:hypothetical protein G5B38_06580 [Pseudohalocynthiibacter aestuariivivens]|nr:hypothetical protein [Pseudohalocynthiibacter aestuariivivens]QIE45218.1 hypothetical protein G5B38_06580 [Pseudohalocynthiibacter aestuariivivens]
MVDKRYNIPEKYLLALRIIQPARIQDIEKAVAEIWPDEMDKRTPSRLQAVHEKMRLDGNLVTVRRGTYLLDQQGMMNAQTLMKERDIDNIRMFLMKQQRRRYHRQARWLG